MGSAFRSTLRLLNLSTFIAISGSFKIYIAFLFLGSQPSFELYLGASLFIYATYTLDRALDCKEDAINRGYLRYANRNFVLFVIALALLISIFLLFKESSPLIAIFPFLTGYLYNKGISFSDFRLRLKGRLGIKNFVVAFTWATTVASLVYPWAKNFLALLAIYIFFFMKSFINTIIYDYRDVKGDAIAGIITLPIYFGAEKLRRILEALHLTTHIGILIVVFLGFIKPELFIFLYSGLIGYLGICLYCSSKPKMERFRDILVDGEWIVAACIRGLLKLSPLSVLCSS